MKKTHCQDNAAARSYRNELGVCKGEMINGWRDKDDGDVIQACLARFVCSNE